MRAPHARQIVLGLSLLGLVALLPACEKDPNDAQTWIDKLDDAREAEDAVRNLERLKDPKAIKPLGKIWRKMNRPSKILRAMVTLAAYENKDPDKGPVRDATWDDVKEFLVEAVESFDPGDQRSIEDAVVAAEALGKTRDNAIVGTLIAAAQKAVPKLSPANAVRIASIRALGKFKSPQGVDVLIRVLGADTETQRIQLFGAAANALAETGDPKALAALTQALIFVGPVYTQARGGITRLGKPAEDKMLAIYREQDAEMNKLAKEKNLAKSAPGTMVFKGAMLLGDMRSKGAIKELLAGLAAPPRVSYFNERTGEPGPPTHNAILDALKRIGDPGTANEVWAYATNPKTDDATRPFAVDTYSWLTTSREALPQLLKWFEDTAAEDQIRVVAMTVYGRLGRTAKDAAPLDDLLKGYDAKLKTAEDKIKNGKSPDDKAAGEDEKARVTQWRFVVQEARWRIDAPIECKDDVACYAKLLEAKDVTPGKAGLPKAERALVEMFKMGPKAAAALPKLLALAGTSERILRDGINLTLPRIAPSPCKQCADELGKVLDAQSDQTTMDALNSETRIVYHYFLANQ